jgi:hypothetical protein
MASEGCTPRLRPVLSAQGLVRLFASSPRKSDSARSGKPQASNVLLEASEVFESMADDELVGLYTDASVVAADLAQTPGVRRLAACVAVVAESARTGFCSWDALLGLADAARALND